MKAKKIAEGEKNIQTTVNSNGSAREGRNYTEAIPSFQVEMTHIEHRTKLRQ